MSIKYNWSKEEILDIYNMPLMELVYKAATVHREYHDPREVQISSLLSIKTGGCPEDCGYCPQSAKYSTEVGAEKMLDVDSVITAAGKAKKAGASRMCLGAAWREVRDNRDFDKVLEMVQGINGMDMEVCCTLGMLTEEQAHKLAAAGLFAYNHNVDTSAEHYEDVISTRDYDDRLNTINNVVKSKVSVCSGGIIGLGESVEDRVGMLITLSSMNPHPGSVPINSLVPVEGTPMEDHEVVSVWEMVRMIATTRIVMPASAVRLSAGRLDRSMEGQALCFMAGANSIFAGDKLLTTPNPDFNMDMEMFDILGLKPKEAYKGAEKPASTLDIEKLKQERAEGYKLKIKPGKVTVTEPRQVKRVEKL